MNSPDFALDTLMTKISYAVGRLTSIREELETSYQPSTIVSAGVVTKRLKVIQNELSSACRAARHATMTEQPTSTPTKLNNTLSVTLAAIEGSVRQIAASMQTLAAQLQIIGEDLKTGCSGEDG